MWRNAYEQYAPRHKSLVGSGVLLPCSELYAYCRLRSSDQNNVSHSLPTLTFLTRLNIAAWDSVRLLGCERSRVALTNDGTWLGRHSPTMVLGYGGTWLRWYLVTLGR